MQLVGGLSTSGGGGADSPQGEYELGLDVLRGLAAQEIVKADSARQRARQAFALAAGFFAVVQTVTFGSFVTKRAAAANHTHVLVQHATWAGLVLGACAISLVLSDLFLRSRDLAPAEVWDIVTNDDPKREPAVETFARKYKAIVTVRRHTNRIRGRLILLTQFIALCSIGVAVWELLSALHAGG